LLQASATLLSYEKLKQQLEDKERERLSQTTILGAGYFQLLRLEAKTKAKKLPNKRLSNQKHSDQIELSLEIGSQGETTPSVGYTVQQAKQASGVNFEAVKALTQGELAKRWGVHTSNVGRHKNREDLPTWNQNLEGV
jgi:Holliday junction resolvasome RuvABC DNA-binding subunit